MPDITVPFEFEDDEDEDIGQFNLDDFRQAVLYSSDWTVETIVSQLAKGNIELNPRFQRRDAWNHRQKSKFIESLILGLPIPQIVLAERREQRGKYIVLDGKQRLLTMMQFAGVADDTKLNAFRLSGLEVRKDLARRRFADLEKNVELQDDFIALQNHTIRAVLIRNWPSTDFLHLVFLRLNTGSVKLSPQELRQALMPGHYSDYIDDVAASSQVLQRLLSRNSPDPRMRDVEILARFVAFQNFIETYPGRMKSFLDSACLALNHDWANFSDAVQNQVAQFDLGATSLIEIFGQDGVARKADSRSFNRAIFDALIYYASAPTIRDQMQQSRDVVKKAYEVTIKSPEFVDAIESDTAGTPHTATRFAIWGGQLQSVLGLRFPIPQLVEGRLRRMTAD